MNKSPLIYWRAYVKVFLTKKSHERNTAYLLTKYEVFNDAQKAIDYIKNENTAPVVVKADGLALGKGVIIAQSVDEAIEAVKEIMEDKKFGDSGNNIVIEVVSYRSRGFCSCIYRW